MEQVDSLKTEKKFKKTEIGEIPVDWEVADLSEVIFSYKNGIWGDDPTLDEKSYPIIRSTEITHDGKLDLSSVAFRKIPEAQIRKYKLQDNDILLVASSGSPNLIGRSALFKQSHDKRIFLFSNFMIRIRPEKIDHYFLFYFLNSQYYHNFLTFLQQTSTGLRNLPRKEFIKMKLPFPPLPEQKKIAEILTTVDEAVEKNDEIIEKTKELKKGLMQELLTRGIGHKKFKKTKVGEIPMEWGIVKLKEIAQINMGQSPPSADCFDYKNGLPFFQGTAEFGTKYPTVNKWCNSPRKVAGRGDILVSVRAPVGDVNVAPEECCIGRGLAAIRGTKSESNFLYFVMNFVKNSLVQIGQGSTFEEIGRASCRERV